MKNLQYKKIAAIDCSELTPKQKLEFIKIHLTRDRISRIFFRSPDNADILDDRVHQDLISFSKSLAKKINENTKSMEFYYLVDETLREKEFSRLKKIITIDTEFDLSVFLSKIAFGEEFSQKIERERFSVKMSMFINIFEKNGNSLSFLQRN